jgi:hypothetical protein
MVIDNAHTSPQKTDGTRRKSEIPLSEIKKYYTRTLMEAAQALGVCRTGLKKLCRSYGITRWPHRKVWPFIRAIFFRAFSPLSQIQAITEQMADIRARMDKEGEVIPSPERARQLADLSQKLRALLEYPPDNQPQQQQQQQPHHQQQQQQSYIMTTENYLNSTMQGPTIEFNELCQMNQDAIMTEPLPRLLSADDVQYSMFKAEVAASPRRVVFPAVVPLPEDGGIDVIGCVPPPNFDVLASLCQRGIDQSFEK